MKKTISIIAMSVLTASLLFGCKAKTDDSQSVDSNQVQAGQAQGNQNGRGQFQMPDLSGQIVSINGNQVTIKVIKQQQFGGNRNSNGGNWNNNGANNNGSNGNNGNNNNSNGNNNNGGSNGNNQSANNGGNGNGGGQSVRPRRQLEFTGETKTLTIADGIEISMTVRGNQGRETKQLKVSDLKANDVLQVWYTDKNQGTISKISVQDLSAMGNFNGGNGGNSGNNNNSNNNGNNSTATAN